MNSKNKIWQDVVKDLSRRIYNKEFAYNAKFFSLTALSKEYSVSDITSRKVISKLTEMGLIKSIPGSGAYIKSRLKEKNIILLIEEVPHFVEANQLPSIPAEKYKGMLMECGRQNADLQILSTRFVRQLPKDRELMIISMGLEFSKDEQLTEMLEQNNFNVVVCGENKTEKFPKVTADYYKGMQLAVEHLAKKGHKRIALMTSAPEINSSMRSRFNGFIETLKSKNLDIDDHLILKLGTPNLENDSDAVHAVLNLKDPPTAIVTANNTRAINVVECCNKNNIKIPQDTALIGFDYIPESLNIDPQITVVNTFWDKVGAQAVKKVLHMAESGEKNVPDTIISPELIIRQTT